MAAEDGLVPEDYNPGQRMSMAQIQAMDENDDSLAAYKASLGLTENPILDDTRPEKLLDFQFGLCFFSDDNGLDACEECPELVVTEGQATYQVKQGVYYKFKADFAVQRELLTGLNIVCKFKRIGVQVASEKEVIGSYAPGKTYNYVGKMLSEIPSGMLGRGTYKVIADVLDTDGEKHATQEFTLKVAKSF